MKTDATEQDERSKDLECCTDHAIPRGCDRICVHACGRSRWLTGEEAVGVRAAETRDMI